MAPRTLSIAAVEWEDRVWQWEEHGSRPTNRADRLFRDYRSAIPARLTEAQIRLEAGTVQAIEQAMTAVAHLDAAATFDPMALLLSESVASSKIEVARRARQDPGASELARRE